MSAETEQGLNALQSGNAAEAVTLLERATQFDPTDYQAFMYLGAAYGQVERHNDAITALTQAVTLQPSNAQGRYNLGTAMERAGHIPQALEAYQQAVQLQPDYPKAQEAAQRLQGASSSASGFAAPTETPTQYAPPASGYTPPAETPAQYAPQGYAQQQPQYAPQPPQYAPPQQGGYAPSPGQQMQGYGQAPNAYGQPGANPYAQPPVYPGGYAPGAYMQAPQTCKEASEALTYSIIGLFCLGIVLGPIGISKALTAKKLIAANPSLTGEGLATGGLIVGIIATAFHGLWIVFFIIGLLASIGAPH